MKMNKFFMSLCAAAAIFGFASCSDDDIKGGDDNKGNTTGSEGVFLSFTMKMAQGNESRSQTVSPGQSTEGNEIGSDAENHVGYVTVVLAKRSNNAFIAAGTVQAGDQLVPGNENTYKATAEITKTALNEYYTTKTGDAAFSPEINVFVFCNPNTELNNLFEGLKLGNTAWVNEYGSVMVTGKDDAVDIWSKNSFLMSNVFLAPRRLPATIDDWDNYKTIATAFDLSGINAAGQVNEVDNSADNGENGGNVRVERVAARFDFKDASNSDKGSNRYNVLLRKVGDEEVPIVDIKLNMMVLTNMCNRYYFLPRVSDNGFITGGNYRLCGNETATNYVVGPYANEYNIGVEENFGNYFNYQFFDNEVKEGYEYPSYDYNAWKAKYYIEDILKNGAEDLYENADKNIEKGSYRVWRYVTENVIPGPQVNQVNGISTGVVFKGRMIADDLLNSEDASAEDKELYRVLNNVGNFLTGNSTTDPILYSYNNTLYPEWKYVREAAAKLAVKFKDENFSEPYFEEKDGKKYLTDVNHADPFYQAVFGSGDMGTFEWNGETYYDEGNIDSNSTNALHEVWAGSKNSANKTKMANAMTKQGFTLYQSSADRDTENGPSIYGYYCHYFYWNRHNDNQQPGTMGVMEFATVRNNVYKLSVSKISRLGHPRTPENDPDSPTPDTPDESDKLYFTVQCEILPWVVRVNDIVF